MVGRWAVSGDRQLGLELSERQQTSSRLLSESGVGHAWAHPLALRDPREAGRGWDGCGLSRSRHAARPHDTRPLPAALKGNFRRQSGQV